MPASAIDLDYLRADVSTLHLAVVDRQRGVIFGAVAAQVGAKFDAQSLDRIVQLCRAQPDGVKSYSPTTIEGSDRLGDFLGRAGNWRRDGDKVRYDLHFNRAAFLPPPGGHRALAPLVMDLIESDPAAVGSRLVGKFKPRGASSILDPVAIQSCDIVAADDDASSLSLSHSQRNTQMLQLDTDFIAKVKSNPEFYMDFCATMAEQAGTVAKLHERLARGPAAAALSSRGRHAGIYGGYGDDAVRTPLIRPAGHFDALRAKARSEYEKNNPAPGKPLSQLYG